MSTEDVSLYLCDGLVGNMGDLRLPLRLRLLVEQFPAEVARRTYAPTGVLEAAGCFFGKLSQLSDIVRGKIICSD